MVNTPHISLCDESGSKWNKPLRWGTGVSTAPCLIFDAEGRTLKFGHERVRREREAHVILWRQKYFLLPTRFSKQSAFLFLSPPPSGLSHYSIKQQMIRSSRQIRFFQSWICPEFSQRHFIVGSRGPAVSVIIIMVLAQKVHTDVKMDLWLVSACLSQKPSCRAHGLNNRAAWWGMQEDMCRLMSDIYLCMYQSVRWISVYFYQINQKTTQKPQLASKEAVPNVQKTNFVSMFFWCSNSDILLVFYSRHYIISCQLLLPRFRDSCDWLDSQQLCAAMHPNAAALPSKEQACEVADLGGLKGCSSSSTAYCKIAISHPYSLTALNSAF